ncbi:MAG: hypothetical protein ACPG8W_10855 [Candidatus Promineifilaceae bacterium]
MTESIFAYAQLNARVQPFDRGDRYADPLQEALETNGWGEVVGGGTMQKKNGEINYCGLDIELKDVEQAVPFICDVLTKCGAPKGSHLLFDLNGEEKDVPFGIFHGLAIYLNGVDLPTEVYNDCDIDHIYSEIDRLLGERGAIQGYWDGPTETALYLYGYSAEEMRTLIKPLTDVYPLCQKARFEIIVQ